MNFYKFMQSQAKYMKVNGSYACGGGVRSDFISTKKRSYGEGVKGSGDYVVVWFYSGSNLVSLCWISTLYILNMVLMLLYSV